MRLLIKILDTCGGWGKEIPSFFFSNTNRRLTLIDSSLEPFFMILTKHNITKTNRFLTVWSYCLWILFKPTKSLVYTSIPTIMHPRESDTKLPPTLLIMDTVWINNNGIGVQMQNKLRGSFDIIWAKCFQFDKKKKKTGINISRIDRVVFFGFITFIVSCKYIYN